MIPLSSQDLDILRDQIAQRPLLYEQMASARKATDRSFNWGPPVALVLVLVWALAFGRSLIRQLIDAQPLDRVESIVRKYDLNADPSEGARLFSIALGALDIVMILMLIVIGTSAAMYALFRRNVSQIPVAIADLGVALLMTIMLLASPSYVTAFAVLIILLLVQRPLRALGHALFGVRASSTSIRTPSQNAQAAKDPTRAPGHVQGAVNRPRMHEDDEEDGMMLRLLDRLRGKGGDDA
jgi:hypothetical protein